MDSNGQGSTQLFGTGAANELESQWERNKTLNSVFQFLFLFVYYFIVVIPICCFPPLPGIFLTLGPPGVPPDLLPGGVPFLGVWVPGDPRLTPPPIFGPKAEFF
jgi:hypothetical protein